jgi:hypothetical protein
MIPSIRALRHILLSKWKWSLVVIVYLVAEYRLYVKQRQRFIHFQQLRERISPQDEQSTSDAISCMINTNRGAEHLINRLRDTGLRQYNCIQTPHDISAIHTCHTLLAPAHQMTLFTGSLYWQYIPLPVWYIMHGVRGMGELYMYGRGFMRQWHPTTDGYYAVWSKYIPNTLPVVILPGLGLGAVPYVEIATRLGRTVHIVEIPNFGCATPLSDRQCTAPTLYAVITSYVMNPDILAHSMGTFWATMFLNEQHARGLVCESSPQYVVLCDGFTHAVDLPRSVLTGFIDWSDCLTSSVCHGGVQQTLVNILVTWLVHNVEAQAFFKRFYMPHTGILWREHYPNTRLLHLYGSDDMLMDARYISENHVDGSTVVVHDGATHGDILFHPSVASVKWTTITSWLRDGTLS